MKSQADLASTRTLLQHLERLLMRKHMFSLEISSQTWTSHLSGPSQSVLDVRVYNIPEVLRSWEQLSMTSQDVLEQSSHLTAG